MKVILFTLGILSSVSVFADSTCKIISFTGVSQDRTITSNSMFPDELALIECQKRLELNRDMHLMYLPYGGHSKTTSLKMIFTAESLEGNGAITKTTSLDNGF